MHTRQRPQRNMALRQQQKRPTQPYGGIAAACVYYDLDNGGGKNSTVHATTHGLSRPASKCRAGCGAAGVCQGKYA